MSDVLMSDLRSDLRNLNLRHQMLIRKRITSRLDIEMREEKTNQTSINPTSHLRFINKSYIGHLTHLLLAISKFKSVNFRSKRSLR
jgi:hypothetical protein